MKTNDSQNSVTVPELARRLGISKQAVWGLIRRGAIAAPIAVSSRKNIWSIEIAEKIVRDRAKEWDDYVERTQLHLKELQLKLKKQIEKIEILEKKYCKPKDNGECNG